MKILFSMRHPGALRNYTSTLKELARRGHQIHLAFMMQDKLGDGRMLWELTNDHPEITSHELGKKTPWRFWLGLARVLRFTTDYVRYLTPEYTDATALRDRAGLRIPKPLRMFFRLPIFRTRVGVSAAAALLRSIERALPVDRWIRDIVASQNPDVVLITPLVDLGSDQVEYAKAARALGIRSGLCVHSWDNLTNKGLIRVLPDRVFVWNEAQKREAVSMHRVKPEHVGVTGAPVYDQWFERRPSTTRQEFCSKTGLSPDKPFFLYLCSSQFIAPDEAEFVADWIRAVRSAPDPRVREAGILIRPHPENLQPWQRFNFEEFQGVALWPRGGANPIDAASKNDYFDSMYHAVAAVGVNTSAQIEAGIVGRPVYSVRVAKYAGTQEGTLHFHYLLKEGGGLLHMADTLEEHAQALTAALDRTEEDVRRLRAFVEAFVRPNGIDVPATPVLADAVEELARLPRRVPERLPLWLYPLRAALYPIAWTMKVVRAMTRLSRKRQSQLRPLSVGNWFLKRTFWLLDFIFRFRPMKRFAKRYIVPRVVTHTADGSTPTEEMVAIPRILQKMARSDRPIIVGPWLSEVGFELLYWIPFLNWVKTYRHFDPERLIIVSRGGVAPWYRDIGATYIDLFDFYPPEQFRAKNEQRLAEGKQKHLLMSQFDREILKVVYQHIGRKRSRHAAPDVHVPAVLSVLEAADVDRARGRVRVVPAAAGHRRVGRDRRAAARLHRRALLLQRVVPRHRREQAVRHQPARHADRNERRRPAEPRSAHRRSLGHAPRAQSADSHRRSPDDAAEQPGDSDQGDQPRARVRRHLRRAVVPGAALRRDVAGLLLASREVQRAASGTGAPGVRTVQARFVRGARHERPQRARPGTG